MERVSYYFRDIRGFAYDEVNAVLAAGLERSGGCGSAAGARSGSVRPTEDFEPLAASFKRIHEYSAAGGVQRRRRTSDARRCSKPGPSAICTTNFGASRDAAHRKPNIRRR